MRRVTKAGEYVSREELGHPRWEASAPQVHPQARRQGEREHRVGEGGEEPGRACGPWSMPK